MFVSLTAVHMRIPKLYEAYTNAYAKTFVKHYTGTLNKI